MRANNIDSAMHEIRGHFPILPTNNATGGKNNMVKPGENTKDKAKPATSRADFIRLAGIGPELAEFVTNFTERPEIFFLMSTERRREIENQMDAIISSLVQR